MEEVNEIRTLTTPEEKSKRFDFINNQLMEKYFELVWFARSDPEKARQNGEKDLFKTITKKLGEIADKYPREVQALCGDGSNWEHGFNSGILAYSRFLAEYLEDTLFEDEEFEDSIELNGKKYVQIDGRTQAFEDFPMLDT
jgi:hypothetical protein